jgi:hypothetical protein
MTDNIPKVTIEIVAKTLEKLKNEEEKCKNLLRYWFRSPKNIDVFSKFIFPEYILGNVPNFHREFYDFLLSKEDGGLAAPRGHAKSTTCGLVFIAWNYCYRIKKYIVYISQNHEKTTQFIEPHRTEPKENKRMRWLYGDLTCKAIVGDNGKDREDCIDINGCRIQALSFEKNIRGIKFKNMRPDLIIGDDIEDDQRIKNPILRNNDKEKLNKAILPSLDIVSGVFKMIGTILHLDSLLMKKIKEYNGKIYRAEDDDGKILWDEYFTRERLDKKRKSIGSVAYQQEYLNNPVDNETSVIKSEWVRACYDYDYDLTYEAMDEVYLGVDFAFSDRISADDSAFVDVGIKRDRYGNTKKYVLNIRWEHGKSLPEQIDIVKDMYWQKKYNMIGFEENSIKSYSKDINDLNMPIRMFWTGSRDAPNNSNKTISYSKDNAVERLGVEFENQMWVIPYNTESQQRKADKLLSELTSWAKENGKLIELGVHPDSPIGMILVNELLGTNVGFSF